MANTLDGGSFKEVWSRVMQKKLEKTDVFRAIANWDGQSDLKEGDVYNLPYRSAVNVQGYTRGTAFTVQDLTNTNESLTVNVAKVAPFYIDDLDALQSHYKLLTEYAEDCAVQLGNWMDGDMLGEYANVATGNTVDDGDLGGTVDKGFTLTTSNVLKAIAVASRKLDSQNVGMNNRFMVISPQVKQILIEYLAGKESALGDSTGVNGHIGKFYGFDLYLSNNTAGSSRLEMGSIPTAADTVVINGVTLTFRATPTAAGEVDVGASAAASLDDLVACINNSGTAGATSYIALTGTNLRTMEKVTATDGTTYMTIIGEGVGYNTVSETLTAGADIWTANLQVQHCLAGQKGATHMIVQKYPKVEVKDVYNLLGKNVASWILYGLKTFNEGTKKIVDIMVRSDAY